MSLVPRYALYRGPGAIWDAGSADFHVVGIDYGTWMRGTQGRVLLSTGGSPLFERLANERFCAVVPLIVINTLVIVYELVLG